MKLVHLSDLHLGKRLNGYSLIEEQADILRKITGILAEERPDAVLLAGDIYDKSVPSEEAVRLLDDFLSGLSARGLRTFLISGNHDSAERLAFGARLVEQSGIHIAPVWHGSTEPVELRDEYGPVKLWLLPFVKPAHVRAAWPEEEIVSYTDALRTVTAHMEIDQTERNVLAAHQYVSGAARSESEEITVGGLDDVSAAVFAPFDYVALGHLHRPQNVAAAPVSDDTSLPLIRYAGSPLAYSFSETDQEKSLSVIEIGEKKGSSAGGVPLKAPVTRRTVPLIPLRGLKEVRGRFADLTGPAYAGNSRLAEQYLHITLTDEQDIPDAFGRLKALYPYLMTLDYDNTRTRTAAQINGAENVPGKTPMELFAELYELQNGAPMTEEQQAYLAAKIEALTEVDA